MKKVIVILSISVFAFANTISAQIQKTTASKPESKGSTGGIPLAKPIVGVMPATAEGPQKVAISATADAYRPHSTKDSANSASKNFTPTPNSTVADGPQRIKLAARANGF